MKAALMSKLNPDDSFRDSFEPRSTQTFPHARMESHRTGRPGYASYTYWNEGGRDPVQPPVRPPVAPVLPTLPNYGDTDPADPRKLQPGGSGTHIGADF